VEVCQECLDLFHSYTWPGNVRELQQVVAAAAALGGYRILPEHLPEYLREPGSEPVPALATTGEALAESFPVSLRSIRERAGREAEKKAILELQKRTQANRQELARILGVDPKTLRSRLREIERESSDHLTPETSD
jgi:DNA-binding NtrC family response regulator